jgi:hypothetical protein
MRAPRSVLAAVTALILAPVLAACSVEVEPTGGGPETVESSAEADTDAELQTVTAEHLTAQVPADWQSKGDVDGWSYVYQLSDSGGGVAGRIGFMPGGAAMTAQEAVDWFIGQIEDTGVTDGDYTPITTLREGEDRANTSYGYESAGKKYKGVVWAISDGNGIPSLIQLSGALDVITPEFVAQVDESLDITGNWKNK